VTVYWDEEAWADYIRWRREDRPVFKRINRLITAIELDPFRGIGKPEPLRHELAGYWYAVSPRNTVWSTKSRRIASLLRLVVTIIVASHLSSDSAPDAGVTKSGSVCLEFPEARSEASDATTLPSHSLLCGLKEHLIDSLSRRERARVREQRRKKSMPFPSPLPLSRRERGINQSFLNLNCRLQGPRT
jgi:Txe/YoeB family toxin of toxin-antitoxin system